MSYQTKTKQELLKIIEQQELKINEYKHKELEQFFKIEEEDRKLKIFVKPYQTFKNLVKYSNTTKQTLEQIINQMINYFNNEIIEFNNMPPQQKLIFNTITKLKPYKEQQEQTQTQELINLNKLKS